MADDFHAMREHAQEKDVTPTLRGFPDSTEEKQHMTRKELVSGYMVRRYAEDGRMYETLLAVDSRLNVYARPERQYSTDFPANGWMAAKAGLPADAEYIGNYRVSLPTV